MGIDPEEYNKIHVIEITSGKSLEKNSGDRILIPDSFAENTGLAAGSTIKVPASYGIAEFTVEGI